MKEINKEKLLNRLKELSLYAQTMGEKLTREFYREYKTNGDYSEKDIITVYPSWSNALEDALSRVTHDSDQVVMTHTNHPENKIIGKDVKEFYKVLVIPDVHIPFQDNKSVNTMIKFAEIYKPDHVIQLGDLVDFYKLSQYMKSPGRGSTVQQELNKAHNLLSLIKSRSNAKYMTLLTGNHEDRLHKYLCNKAPALTELDALKLENLLKLQAIDCQLIPSTSFYRINNVYFTHGEFCNVFSSLKHMNKYNETIIHGHTHVVKSTMARYLNKTIEAWEIGCLASMDTSEEYVKMPNWQHAFATVEFLGSDYWIRPHHIRNNRVSINGQVVEGDSSDPTK